MILSLFENSNTSATINQNAMSFNTNCNRCPMTTSAVRYDDGAGTAFMADAINPEEPKQLHTA